MVDENGHLDIQREEIRTHYVNLYIVNTSSVDVHGLKLTKTFAHLP
jgi:hypothetical protein